MTPEERETFINEVSLVVQKNNADDDYPYYRDFFNDCERYGLDEHKFNIQVLAPAFGKYTGPVEPTSGPHCILFGKAVYSTRQMAKQFFANPAKSEVYMEDHTLFKADIRKIENSDRTLELVAVFDKENDISKRYLRVIYHLNPQIGYRIALDPQTKYNFERTNAENSDESENISQLLKKGVADYNFYRLIFNEFNKGYLQIWLEECDGDTAKKLNGGTDYNSFLKFIYKVDNTLGFYLFAFYFRTPTELVRQAQTNVDFRGILFAHMENDQLRIWFNSLGKGEWNERYDNIKEKLSKITAYNDQDKSDALIQSLLLVLDPALVPPKFIINPTQVDRLNIEASGPIMHTLQCRLENTGILKGIISLDNNIEGIGINRYEVAFNSFTKETAAEVAIKIDAAKLKKGQPYHNCLIVELPDEKIKVPINLMVVFPKKTYILYMAKYGAICGLFFFLLRNLLTQYSDFSYSRSEHLPRLIAFFYRSSAVYANSIAIMLIGVSAFIISFFLIKKFEKV